VLRWLSPLFECGGMKLVEGRASPAALAGCAPVRSFEENEI
jgi:hypothetical protein